MNILKKWLPAVLILSLLAGLLIPAFAAQIPLGQPQNITVVDDETPAIFQFAPTESGYYRFYSFYSEASDPYGYITDENGDILAEGDDTEYGLDFSIPCYMEAGKTYTLAATCYSGSATYTVQLDLLPNPTSITFEQEVYTGGIRDTLSPQVLFFPQGCAEETVTLTSSDENTVLIGEDGDIYLLVPGTATVTATSFSGLTATCTVTVTEPEVLPLDTPWTMDAQQHAQYLQFTAPDAGWYGINSAGDEVDTAVDVLDENLDGLNSDDGSLPNGNFFAPFYLKENQRCYIYLKATGYSGMSLITLQKLNAATGIALPQTHITGYVDTVCRLEPVLEPLISIPEDQTWKSSNEEVVYVDFAGRVSYLEPGEAVITVTSESGKTASMAVTVLPAPTGYNLVDWGICGPNLQWQLNNTGLLTITGYGQMYDLYDNQCHWDDHVDRITRVQFPEGITSIGYGAFMNCQQLTEVVIPDSVRHIGNSAFSCCTSMSRVILPESLETMNNAAFECCWALEEIRLPDGLRRIPFNAFVHCLNLSKVTLPKNLVSIGDYAFTNCIIEQIDFPDSLKTIGISAFSHNLLTEVRLPEGLTELRDYALVHCRLQELTLPSTVTGLGSGFVLENPLHTLYFLGNAPAFDHDALEGLNATACYPAANRTWTRDVRKDYGGTITWVPEGDPGVTLSGTAAEGTVLTLSQGEDTPETRTAENGSYVFPGLLPGTYTLTAAAENCVTRTYTLTVTDGDLTQDVTLHLIGDIDGSGRVNMGDVIKLNAHVKGVTPITDEYELLCANINGGKINTGDVSMLYAHVKGSVLLY